MLEEDLHKKMRQQCLDEIKASGWWIFNKKEIQFSQTEFIDECNIQIIQQLPDKICFPKNKDDVVIDDKGVKLCSLYYSWSEIIATGIKTEVIPMEYENNYRIYLLIGLKDGRTRESELRNNIEYLKQIGHIIELYKLKFKKKNT